MFHPQAVNVKHHKVGKDNEPVIYRITDDLEYSVEIYEWSGTNWEPYVTDDVQVQFYMMSPYVLKTLTTDNKGLYFTSFKVPDVYGVFQFKVEYQRLGYTTLSLSKQVLNECNEHHAEAWLRLKKRYQDALPKYTNKLLFYADVKTNVSS
ncbi:hypothetical protein QQ045_001913 [Rhodiola kirilowii]